MNRTFLTRAGLFLAVVASLLTSSAPSAIAQNVTDEIEIVRGLLKADRKVVVAEALQLTEPESAAFWPLYRDYRADMDRLGDEAVKLVLEYADAYPNVAEERAAKMLKGYMALEKALVGTRARHLKKIAKVLPSAKVLRFAQVENRLDIVVRLQMASSVPLVPTAPSAR